MRISRFTHWALWLCLFLAAGTVNFAYAAPAKDESPAPPVVKEEPPKKAWQQLKPERLVSDSAFIYVATPDFRKMRAALDRSALKGLLAEEDVAALLGASFDTMQDVYVTGDGTRSEPELRRRKDEIELLKKLAPLLDGQTALAIEGEGASAFLTQGTLPKFLLVAVMPAGDKGLQRQAEIDEIMRKHRADETQDSHYKDFDGKTGPYAFQRVENPDIKVDETWAFVENLFVYGQGKKIVEDSIERYLNNGAGSLSAHAGYQSAYKEVARDEKGEALLYLQMDLRPMVKLNLLGSPDQAAEMEANRPHIAMGVMVADGEKAAIREKTFFRVAKADQPKGGEPCAAVTARFAQNDTLFYTSAQSSLVDIYKHLAGNIKAAPKPPAEAEKDPKEVVAKDPKDPKDPNAKDTKAVPDAASMLELLKSAFGVQNEAEVAAKLEMFKGEIGVIVSEVPQPALKMERLADYLEVFQPVFAIEVDSGVPEQNLKTLLAGIEAKTGRTYEKASLPISNKIVFYQKEAAPGGEKSDALPGLFLNLVNPSKTDAKNVPFFAAYSIVDIELDVGKQRKFLLLSDSVNALKKAVQQSQPKFARTSLDQDKQFQTLLKSFRESRYTVGYLDLPRLLDVVNSALPRLTKQGLFRRDDLARFPSPNVLRDHLFPMAWSNSVVAEPSGMLFEMSSPMGNLPMLGLFGSVAWPYINSNRRQTVSDEVDEKFKRIFLGLHLYAADKDRYPQQLSELVVGNYIQDLSVFESPFSRGMVKTPQDVDDPVKTNLIYVPGHSLMDEGGQILLYEKDPTRLIVTGDGSRLWHHLLTVDGSNAGKKRQSLPKASLELRLQGKPDYFNTNVVDAPSEQKQK